MPLDEEFYSPYVDMDTGEILDTFEPDAIGPRDLHAIATQLATIDTALELDAEMIRREMERLRAVYAARAAQLERTRGFLLDCAEGQLATVKSHRVPDVGMFQHRKQVGKIEATDAWRELGQEEQDTFMVEYDQQVGDHGPVFKVSRVPNMAAIKKRLAELEDSPPGFDSLVEYFTIVGKGEIKFDFKKE